MLLNFYQNRNRILYQSDGSKLSNGFLIVQIYLKPHLTLVIVSIKSKHTIIVFSRSNLPNQGPQEQFTQSHNDLNLKTLKKSYQ